MQKSRFSHYISAIWYILLYRGREKKYNDVKSRTEKISRGFEVLELDLEEIQGKVDQYLTWLAKKEEQAQITTPRGYSVQEAEEKVQYLNVSFLSLLCHASLCITGILGTDLSIHTLYARKDLIF